MKTNILLILLILLLLGVVVIEMGKKTEKEIILNKDTAIKLNESLLFKDKSTKFSIKNDNVEIVDDEGMIYDVRLRIISDNETSLKTYRIHRPGGESFLFQGYKISITGVNWDKKSVSIKVEKYDVLNDGLSYAMKYNPIALGKRFTIGFRDGAVLVDKNQSLLLGVYNEGVEHIGDTHGYTLVNLTLRNNKTSKDFSVKVVGYSDAKVEWNGYIVKIVSADSESKEIVLNVSKA